jgi:hypothetical protein
VDQVPSVRLRERISDLENERHHARRIDALAQHRVPQVAARNELHDEVAEDLVLPARIEDAHHGRMRQFHHYPRTAKEPLATLLISRKVVVQHLDRHGPPHHGVMRFPDHGEAAASKWLEEDVAPIAQVGASP